MQNNKKDFSVDDLGPQKIEMTPIGFFKSKQVLPYQASRQPDENSLPGQIVLNANSGFEQALQNLVEVTHIWLIYNFHLNSHWNPLVQTPRSENKIGVFATRAPYRPNPIGMTCVSLIAINDLVIDVGPNDLLEGTPILDIKPYHPESDVVSDAKINWLDNSLPKHDVQFSPLADSQIDYLLGLGTEIKTFSKRQLEYDPLNSDKKRLASQNGFFTLSYRTWRIDFLVSDLSISIIGIRSGYSAQDLDIDSQTYEDKYSDKLIHLKFNAEFS